MNKRPKKLILPGANPPRARKYFKSSTKTDEIIERLEDDEDRDRIFFLTEQRRMEVCVLMKDTMNNGPLLDKTDEKCAWCRYTFETAPIGLPIKYHSSCVRSRVYGVNRLREVAISEFRMEEMKWMDDKLEPQCCEMVLDKSVTPLELERLIIKKNELNALWKQPAEDLAFAINVVRAHILISEDTLLETLDTFIEESQHLDETEIETLEDVQIPQFKKIYNNIPQKDKGRRLRMEEAFRTLYYYPFLDGADRAIPILQREATSATEFGFYDCTINSPLDVADQLESLENLALSYRMKIRPLTIVERDYFETDFVFCSFNCAKAYAHDNAHDFRYRHSLTLLVQLFKRLYNTPVYKVGDRTKLDESDPRYLSPEMINDYAQRIMSKLKPIQIPTIIKAPSWKLIRGNGAGGTLTIDEFRTSFCKCRYSPLQMSRKPYMFPSGMMFEMERLF